jgi:type IV pilus assembly protein PilE
VKKSSMGFTLIELMMVVVIAGILFFVALPSYREAILKSNRNAARGALMDVVSRQEQYFINNKEYADDLDDLGYGVNAADEYLIDDQAQLASPENSAIYKIEIVPISTLTYQATPINRQAKDTKCNKLWLEQTGTRYVKDATLGVSECW